MSMTVNTNLKHHTTFANLALCLFILTSTGLGQSNYVALVFKILLFIAVINGFCKRQSRSNYCQNTFYKWGMCFIAIFWLSLSWAVNGNLGFPIVVTVTLNILYCCFTFYLINGSVCSLRQNISMYIAGSIIYFFYLYFSYGGVMRGESEVGASVLTMGHLAAISSIFCYYRFSIYKNKRLKNTILFIVLFAIVFISGTRKALFLPILSIGLYKLLLMKGTKKIGALISIFVVGMIGLYMIMEIPTLYNLIGVRIETMISGFEGGDKNTSDASTLQRLAFIEYGIEGIANRPWLGFGPDSFIYMYTKDHPGAWTAYSHNNFIEICFSIGIIGLLVYYSIYYFILRMLWKNYKRNKDSLNLLFFSLLVGIITIHYGWVAYFSLSNNLVLVFAAAYAYRKV